MTMRGARIVVVAVVVALLSPAVSGNAESDALIAVKRALVDPNNVLNSWDSSLVNACTWFHITCDGNNNVIRVDLQNRNLGGHIAPELGQLQHLQYLELYNNHIQGTIPPELGNLRNLLSLDLYGNGLTGNIPQELGNLISLLFFRLNNNHLTGRVPDSVTHLPNIRVFDISDNNLDSSLAVEVSELKNDRD